MKTSFAALLMLPALALASTAYAATPPETCATKQQSIKQQLENAHQHNNKDQIAGLQKALSESQAHCSEANLQKTNSRKLRKNRSRSTSVLKSLKRHRQAAVHKNS